MVRGGLPDSGVATRSGPYDLAIVQPAGQQRAQAPEGQRQGRWH